jgi:hypothetical protein
MLMRSGASYKEPQGRHDPVVRGGTPTLTVSGRALLFLSHRYLSGHDDSLGLRGKGDSPVRSVCSFLASTRAAHRVLAAFVLAP